MVAKAGKFFNSRRYSTPVTILDVHYAGEDL